MIIKTIMFAGLVACPQQHHCEGMTLRVWHSPTEPIAEWPERQEPRERGEHPGHGEGSDESPMFVGTTANSNVSSGQFVTVDSGASATPYIHNGWLAKGLNLVTSTAQLVVENPGSPFPVQSQPVADALGSRATTRDRRNPSTIKIRHSWTKQFRG